MRLFYRISFQRRRIDKMIDHANNIVAQHNLMSEHSPIKCCDMDLFSEKIKEVSSKLTEERNLHADAEGLTEETYMFLGIHREQDSRTPGTVKNTLIKIRKKLKIVYHGKEEGMSKYEFNVVGSRKGVRINIPGRKIVDYLDLVNSIYKIHNDFGESSEIADCRF